MTRATRLVSLAMLAIALAATLPYLSTIDNYFAQDDFGVVQLLAGKPAAYFPRWFTTTWMDDIWGFIPDEIRPFPAGDTGNVEIIPGAGIVGIEQNHLPKQPDRLRETLLRHE